MSAALQLHGDTSSHSSGPPDLSLGSFASILTPQKPSGGHRVPSTTSQTTAASSAPLHTPSPPGPTHIRRKTNDLDLSKRSISLSLDDGVDEGATRWDAPDTPLAPRPGRTRQTSAKGGVNLTLRDQERHIDNLKKENFSLKLKVHFLEERLAQLAPDQLDAALKQNIHLKIEVQQRSVDAKKNKKTISELERALERLKASSASSARNFDRERELEELLEERDRELRELRRRRAMGPDEEALRIAEQRNVELEQEVEEQRALMEANLDEIENLREMVEQQQQEQGNQSGISNGGGEGRKERRMRQLEEENEDLKMKLEEQAELIAHREDEREDLADEVERLRLELEDMERRRDAENIERSESRAAILEEREEREAVESDYNATRDQLAALTIELQQKEDDLELKNQEIDELVAEHKNIVRQVEDDWRGELEEAQQKIEEMQDNIAERDTESKELRIQISDLEAQFNELHGKYEEACANLEAQLDEREEEIENANREIDRLGQQSFQLEEERDELSRVTEDQAAERDRLTAVVSALKDKIVGLKAQVTELSDAYDTCQQSIHEHRERQEELARHVERLVDELQHEQDERARIETVLEAAEKTHDAEIRRERRALEGKESALQSAMTDLARTQSLLSQREADLEAVQNGLRTLEAESRKLGESHTNDRFSLELEVDRLKRDLERLEDEVQRARAELAEKEARGREREGAVDRLHGENRDLAAQLAAQTQARLNVSEKLDGVQASLKTAEGEVTTFRTRIAELEQRLAKDQRSLLQAENQYRDQLTERNTLLLTIYQYMDKILGVDKTPKKAETKPFTNFSVFHDNLISRLKSLSQITLDFDKRAKETETRYTEKLNEMKKQLDHRWRQIDKFEASLKTLAEAKASWRRKLSAKEGELEATKASLSDLQSQMSSTRRTTPGDAMEVRALQARASNAERRLTNAQNQLLQAEEKLATVNQRTTMADEKWEARVKEYETRLRTAEERVKRERQGAKERCAELENQIKSLERQIDLAKKRNQQLTDVVETNKVDATTPRR